MTQDQASRIAEIRERCALVAGGEMRLEALKDAVTTLVHRDVPELIAELERVHEGLTEVNWRLKEAVVANMGVAHWEKQAKVLENFMRESFPDIQAHEIKYNLCYFHEKCDGETPWGDFCDGCGHWVFDENLMEEGKWE